MRGLSVSLSLSLKEHIQGVEVMVKRFESYLGDDNIGPLPVEAMCEVKPKFGCYILCTPTPEP